MGILNPEMYERLAESNPQKLQDEEEVAIHNMLTEIIADTKLHDAVRDYGRPIAFSESGHDNASSFRGFLYLELNPEKGLVIAMKELDFYADSMSETHLSIYPLNTREGKVFFKDECGKEIDAAKAVTFETGPRCNVDYSKAQTARGILDSLEETLLSKLVCK